MLATIAVYILQPILDIISFALMLRFMMQWMHVPFQNPVGRLSVALTNFIVKPTRRWIGNYKRWDLSTLLLAVIAQILLQWILRTIVNNPLTGMSTLPFINVVALGLFDVIGIILDIFFYAIILQVILSWLNPQNPISDFLIMLTRPILRPIQAVLPIIEGFDFSSLFALIFLRLLSMAILPSIASFFDAKLF